MEPRQEHIMSLLPLPFEKEILLLPPPLYMPMFLPLPLAPYWPPPPSPPPPSPPPPPPPPKQPTHELTLMQINGRKTYGPSEHWSGPPPSAACEVHVRHIPKELTKQQLLHIFQRYGDIYELRMPLDMLQCHRSYAYVKYVHICLSCPASSWTCSTSMRSASSLIATYPPR